MLHQLREGLNVYNLMDVLETNQKHCCGLSIIGATVKKMEILNFFQDFLLYLKDAEPEDQESLAVPEETQWFTGHWQRHLVSETQHKFRVKIRFDLDCVPDRTVRYPVVSACTDTFPTLKV
uniref:Uncharacterized protein n=1 Tax=Electrophorus electricus TaxID=8005 RepID=A0A4W4EUW7_ELEEL